MQNIKTYNIKMKKLKICLVLITLLMIPFVISGCQKDNTLLLLNWGEYINDEIIENFEKEYNCEVKMSIADSNELFYAKVKSGTTAYDLVVPSDYMTQKMYENDLLEKLDFSKIPNYDINKFMPGVRGIMSEMFEGNEAYHVPYFWGTFGLMYNKQVRGLEDAILEKGWTAYFNPSLLPSGTRIGMYNVPRYAFAATMFYQNISPNVVNEEMLKTFEQTLRGTKIVEWGNDTLKKGIVANNLDLAFVYTGDYLDMLYTRLDEGAEFEDITFDIYIPDETIAFVDSLVMPKNSRHKDLAYKFINYMLEPKNAYLNASVVGYCTPLISSYEMIANPVDLNDSWLRNWSIAIKRYYPLPNPGEKQYKGTPLRNLSKDELTKITNIVNKVKTTN